MARGKFIPLTQAEIDKAAHKDIKEFLEGIGEKVKPSGTEWFWEKHDSVKIRGHVWYRHSGSYGGTAIDFLQEFYDLHFYDAVCTLLNGKIGLAAVSKSKEPPKEKPKMVIPQRNKNNARALAYLCKNRNLSYEVIAYFIKIGLIYESLHHHNVVFSGKDKYHVVKHCAVRGTLSDHPYKGEIKGSDKSYAFNYIGRSTILYIFEAPIDSLSYISLGRATKDWKRRSFLSTCGFSRDPIDRFLTDFSYINTLIFCYDNDTDKKENWGKKAYENYKAIYEKKGYTVKSDFPTAGDWNDVLINQKEEENSNGQ